MSKKISKGRASPQTEKQMGDNFKFKAIFELTNDIIVYVDTQGKILDVNGRVEEVLGYKPEELEGKDFTKSGLISLRDAPAILKLFWDSVRKGKVADTTGKASNVVQVELNHKNGSRVMVEASTTSVREGGKLKGFVSIVRDLTERKRTEAALRQTKGRYQELFYNSPMGIYRTTQDGRILMANPTLVEMLGYSSFEELASRNLEQEGFEPSYPRARFKETMESRDEVKGLEAAWIRKDKSVIFVRENAKAVRDKTGVTSYYEGTVEDITERKRAEGALRDSEERFRTLFESTREALVTADPDGKILSANPAAAKMLGYDSPADLLGICTSQFYTHPEEREAVLKELKDNDCVEDFEISLRRKDGSDAYILLSITTQRDDQGSILRTDGIFRDITERKLAEEALRESEARYVKAEEIGGFGHWDRDFIEDEGTWSPGACRIFGVEPDQSLTAYQEFLNFVHLSDRGPLKAKVAAARSHGEAFDAEYRIIRPDGEERVIHSIAEVRFDESGQPRRLVGTVHDITERKRAEEALRKARDELEQRVQERTAELVGANRQLRQEIEERKRTQRALQESELWMRNMFDSLEEAVLVVTPDRALVNINQASHKMFGYTKEELVDLSTEVLHVDHRHYVEFGKRIKEAFDKGQTANFEFEAKRKNGEVFPTEHTVSLLKNDMGKALGIVSVVRDITERRRVEEQLKLYRDHLEELVQERTAKLTRTNEQLQQEITERKKAEEALRESEEKYRRLFETETDAIMIFDAETRQFVDVNDAAIHLYGYSREEFLDLKHGDIKAEADESELSIEQTLARKVSRIPIRYHKKKDGTIFPVEISASSFTLKGRQVLCGVVRDITERKRAEEELRKFKTISEKAGYGVSIVGLEGNIIYNNKAYASMHGYTPDELVGKHLSVFHAEQHLEKVNRLIEKLNREGMYTAEEVWHKRRDNTEFPTLMNGTLITDEKGIPLFMAATAVDITERKRAEEALQKSHDMALIAEEVASMGSWEWDLESDKVTWSENCCRIHGIQPQRFDGRLETVIGLIHADDRELVQQQIEGMLAEKTPRHFEYRIVTPGGDEKVIHGTNKMYFDGEGKLIRQVGMVQDITERKQAEEALRESEERFSKAFHASPDPMTLSRLSDGLLLEVNDSWEQVLGYSRTESVGTSSVTLGLWRDPAVRQKCLQQLRETGSLRDFETELRRKTGEVLQVILSSEPLEIGSEQCLLTLIRDITERKQTELALSESEERFRRALENIPDVVVIYAPDLRIRYINAATRRLTGRPTSDFIGKRDDEVWPPEVYQVYLPTLREAFNTRAIRSLETDLSLPGGGIRNLKITCVPLVDEEGKVREILGITHDFTEHRQAQEALREGEKKYRDLVENINDVIYSTDEKGTITYISPVIESFSGYKPSKVIGRNYLEFIHAEDKPAVMKSFQEVSSGDIKPSEYRMISKDNKEVWIRTYSRPAFEKGTFAGLRGVMTDVTERKRLFQQLIQSEKSAAVGTLAYGIAHEFNNILAGIMANAEYGLSADDLKQVRECFKVIVENSQRGSSITNSLLAVAGEKKRKRELADVKQSLENVLSFSRRELEKVGVRLIQHLKDVPEILCDSGEFSEVFLNIINNARDAMVPGGGALTVRVAKQGDNIRISFQDIGGGIPDEIKDRIFDPFVTTKGAMGKSGVPGTGLGLYLSYGIITSYGGRIEVKSAKDKGTTFTILIPVSRNLPPMHGLSEETLPSEEMQRKLNILLIDDEESICSILKKFLESKGHKVTTSLEAREGLAHFNKGQFDVVLSDITMPGMDGIELIRKMKKKDKHSKIIAITGHVRQSKLDEAKDAGAEYVLVKPFKTAELCETIVSLYRDSGNTEKEQKPGE